MRHTTAIVLLTWGTLLGAPYAQALRCRSPRPSLVPAHGELPPRPTVFVFIPQAMLPRVAVAPAVDVPEEPPDEWASIEEMRFLTPPPEPDERESNPIFEVTTKHGTRVPVIVREEASDASAERVFALTIDASSAVVDVAFRSEAAPAHRQRLGRLVIGASRKEPVLSEAVRVAGVHSAFELYAEGRILELSVAASAYRVLASDSLADWIAGRRSVLLYPGPEKAETSSSKVYLGDRVCGGTSFEWRGPGAWIGVVALFSDGSESPMPTHPTYVTSPSLEEEP